MKRCVAVLIAGLMLLGSACSNNSQLPLPVPNRICELDCTQLMSGKEANKFIYRMHGTPLGTTTSAVCYYGPDPAPIVLYVSWFTSVEIAEQALQKMTDKMAAGAMGFAPVNPAEDAVGKVFYTTGMGAHHCFFRDGNAVVWVQAVPELSERAFSQARSLQFER